MNENTLVLVAITAAVAGGIAIAAAGISQLIRATDFIPPVGTLWVNAIRMTLIHWLLGYSSSSGKLAKVPAF